MTPRYVGLLSCLSRFPFRMMSSSWLIRALCKWKVFDTVLATLGCSRQRLHNSLILAMAVLMVVLRSSNLRAWWARQMSNFLHVVAGRSLMYKLKRVGTRIDPCGIPFFCTLHELLMSPMWTRNRRCPKSSSMTLTANHGKPLDSFTNRPLCHIVSYAAVKSRIMGQRSRRIPRKYPKETKYTNRSPNSETHPGNDLNHQGAVHVFLDIGPAIRILQLNIEGINGSKIILSRPALLLHHVCQAKHDKLPNPGEFIKQIRLI